MNNQTKTIITGKDDHINTTEDLNNSKENTTPPVSEISQGPHESKTFIPWNWRWETDTAELFVAMLG
jgi:hypothetical protein